MKKEKRKKKGKRENILKEGYEKYANIMFGYFSFAPKYRLLSRI